MDRTILHCDCNCFYASVECLYNPDIRNKPVAVGGDEQLRHGIILTKNYIASKYSIQTGEPIWSAKQKCPDLIVVPPHFDRYIKFSNLTRQIYCDYTDRVEPFGLDEAWLDVSGCDGMKVAKEISDRIKYELGITVSIGVSYNKVFAKFGSDYKKPDAITEITRENYKDIVWSAPVRDLLYVGKANEQKFHDMGVYTIGQIAQQLPRIMKNHFGKVGEMLLCFAKGEDSSPVMLFSQSNQIKSIGNSTTTPKDMETIEDAKRLLLVLSDSVCSRLRKSGLKCKCVSVTMKESAFLTSSTRQATLRDYTDITRTIYKTAVDILKNSKRRFIPLRAIGISLSEFESVDSAEQLNFYEDHTKNEKLKKIDSLTDSLHQRFGNKSIAPASILVDEYLTSFDPQKDNTIHPEGFLKGKIE